jgi:hypothetical protein
MLARILIPGTLLLLTACALAPGYTPPPFKEKSKMSKAMESGDIQENGRYEMSATEKAMDCKRMTGSMQIVIARMRDSYGHGDPSTAAWAAQNTMTPVLGGSAMTADRQAVNVRERAKLEAYNEELAAKNCKTLDIEAELAKPPETLSKKY